jgi:heme/copper-type cytochrome/quinol oxidase subunit 2
LEYEYNNAIYIFYKAWFLIMLGQKLNEIMTFEIIILSIGIGVFIVGSLFISGIINFYNTPLSNDHSQHLVMAQPTKDFPIPDAKRMFTSNTAFIKRFTLDPYILDMAVVPKNVVAGKPTFFVFNLFSSSSNTWLWHSDLRFVITDPKGQQQLVLPNLHGHGSVVQIEYVFPTKGVYNVDIIFGQQTGSPNFMIEPKVIRDANFDLTVLPTGSPSPSNAKAALAPVKDIPIKAESWKFTPNVINVKKGDLVKLHFTVAQDEVELYNGHGFGIEGYNVNVFLLKGTQQEVDFIADKPGTFTFRCTSFCSSPEAALENHFNMVGKLIVHA